jgi:hypothetical protein
MTEIRCPQCNAQIDRFWHEGINERWFVYCTECCKIVHIRMQELAYTDYTAPLHVIMAN